MIEWYSFILAVAVLRLMTTMSFSWRNLPITVKRIRKRNIKKEKNKESVFSKVRLIIGEESAKICLAEMI